MKHQHLMGHPSFRLYSPSDLPSCHGCLHSTHCTLVEWRCNFKKQPILVLLLSCVTFTNFSLILVTILFTLSTIKALYESFFICIIYIYIYKGCKYICFFLSVRFMPGNTMVICQMFRRRGEEIFAKVLFLKWSHSSSQSPNLLWFPARLM